jgi:hypothetical protein
MVIYLKRMRLTGQENGLIRVRATTVCPSAHGFTAE